jgi:hypothetical protein
MRSDLALQAPATDAPMRASQAWAPVTDAPMHFGPGFDLDTALEPIYVPLHAQWMLEDSHAYALRLFEWADAFASHMLRLIAFVLFMSALPLWLARSAHKDTKRELSWTQDELAECETLLGDTATSLFDVRDALRRRQFGEALYLADRALEVA